MPSAVTAFRLVLLTDCLLSEIQSLRWKYVKDDSIELPGAKTGDQSFRSDARPARFWPTYPARRTILGSSPVGCWAPISPTCRSPCAASARTRLEDVRIHDLMHDFASRAPVLGETLPVIGKLLDHSEIEATARYVHLALEPHLKGSHEEPTDSFTRDSCAHSSAQPSRSEETFTNRSTGSVL